MNAVAVALVTLLLLPAGARFAKAQLPLSDIPQQNRTTDGRFNLAQGQLPSIDRPAQVPSHDIAVTTRNDGHFFFNTEVNGVNVPMLFDTGARFVSLRAEDAKRVGIDVGSLNYSLRMTTANGLAAAAPVTIKVIKVGGIVRTNVPGIVGQPGALGVNLLGQTFTSTMAGFSTEGDRLTLRGE
jgi:clan AA aspartic protease (TIGR02281 family)